MFGFTAAAGVVGFSAVDWLAIWSRGVVFLFTSDLHLRRDDRKITTVIQSGRNRWGAIYKMSFAFLLLRPRRIERSYHRLVVWILTPQLLQSACVASSRQLRHKGFVVGPSVILTDPQTGSPPTKPNKLRTTFNVSGGMRAAGRKNRHCFKSLYWAAR